MTTEYKISVHKVSLVRDSGVAVPQKQIRSSNDAAAIFRVLLDGVDREHFAVAMVDKKHKVIGLNIVSIGSISASVVHPREVFKPAIISNAAAIVLCHNHPSGDPTPSREDNEVTARLKEAGRILGIDVLDHIILGDGTDQYYSYADEGGLAR
jgi:DNA repair protein RadC